VIGVGNVRSSRMDQILSRSSVGRRAKRGKVCEGEEEGWVGCCIIDLQKRAWKGVR